MYERRFRLLVVDDHEVVNWGLRVLLTQEDWVQRCVTARSAEQAVAHARRYDPHVALIDVHLGGESGVDVARQVKEIRPGVRILLMSGAGPVAPKALRVAKAAGFVSKAWLPEDIVRAIRIVGLGKTLDMSFPAPLDAMLSRRERDVLALVATGATNAQVAQALNLSMHTVKQHASAAYKKLSVRNRAEAVLQAERLGLIA